MMKSFAPKGVHHMMNAVYASEYIFILLLNCRYRFMNTVGPKSMGEVLQTPQPLTRPNAFIH